jgi:hypothetical protein
MTPAAVIHFDNRTRRWRASNWAGALNADGFGSYAEAEAAVRRAPPRPKPEKELKVRKLSPRTRAEGLTCRDEQRRIFDERGKKIGAVTRASPRDTPPGVTRASLAHSPPPLRPRRQCAAR